MYGETFYGRHTAQHQLQWKVNFLRDQRQVQDWCAPWKLSSATGNRCGGGHRLKIFENACKCLHRQGYWTGLSDQMYKCCWDQSAPREVVVYSNFGVRDAAPPPSHSIVLAMM